MTNYNVLNVLKDLLFIIVDNVNNVLKIVYHVFMVTFIKMEP